MQLNDQQRRCRDCGARFTFTVDEQRYFETRGYAPPARCRPCRAKRRQLLSENARRRPTICVRCGGQAYVSFIPRWDRPAYCQDCYRRHTKTLHPSEEAQVAG